jgi:hypothetical protein
MVKKIKNYFFVAIFIIFIFLTFQYYFSENNIKFTNKSRSSYSAKSENDIMQLPLLKNNTNNIIVYKNDINEFKEKRKKRFWEKLISNND